MWWFQISGWTRWSPKFSQAASYSIGGVQCKTANECWPSFPRTCSCNSNVPTNGAATYETAAKEKQKMHCPISRDSQNLLKSVWNFSLSHICNEFTNLKCVIFIFNFIIVYCNNGVVKEIRNDLDLFLLIITIKRLILNTKQSNSVLRKITNNTKYES